jgi:hypothetical protein
MINKNKKMSREKKVLLIEGILVVGILAYLFFSAAPEGVSIAGQTIFDSDYTLEIERGDQVIISTNIDFENPIVLEQGDSIDLPPGTYYWKAKNWLRESKVQNFTIQSNVGLDLFIRGEDYELENSGNVDLEVSGKKSGITTALEPGESIDVEEDNYEGKQEG